MGGGPPAGMALLRILTQSWTLRGREGGRECSLVVYCHHAKGAAGICLSVLQIKILSPPPPRRLMRPTGMSEGTKERRVYLPTICHTTTPNARPNLKDQMLIIVPDSAQWLKLEPTTLKPAAIFSFHSSAHPVLRHFHMYVHYAYASLARTRFQSVAHAYVSNWTAQYPSSFR